MTNIAAADVADPFNPIEHAGHMLERHAAGDTTVPNLLEVTGVHQHRMATASGLNDYDYQKLSTLTRNEAIGLNQIETVSKVPIPPEIMEHFKHIKCHCMMGLFPEIGRAWLTIDSDLYIWTYENAQDVAYFDGVNHLIISVALVRPKPNVFIDDVRHLLIVTTPIEIVVLGVIFADGTGAGGTAQMQLMDKPIFTVCTDNVAMTAIVGTADDRRIMLGGRDGCLYELVYQAESNWFGKRCKKVNHSQSLMSYVVPGFLKVFAETDSLVRLAVDDTRACLYTLSEKGAIEAWDLAGGEARRIARLTAGEVTAYAAKILRTVDTTIFKPIVSICPLTLADSPHMHLLCVTQDGVRLYFATRSIDFGPLDHRQHHQQSQQQQQQQQQQSPSHHGIAQSGELRPYTTFQLLHVRLPPGYTFNVSVVKPKSVRSAHYAAGNLLMVSTPQQDQDVLWSLSAQPFPLRPYLTESSTVLPLSGQVWSMAAAASTPSATSTSAGDAGSLATFDENAPAARVVLLTNQGTQVVAMQRPVHMLQQLLFKCRGPNHEAVRAFFESMSLAHACAAAVLLACAGAQRNTEIGVWARQAFLLYGGEPHFGGGGGGGGAYGADTTAANRTLLGGPSAEAQHIAMSTPAQHGLQFQQSQFNQSGLALGTTFGSPIGSPPQAPAPAFQFGRDSPRHPGALVAGGGGGGACVQYSYKHTGLYLHASRVLRRLWQRRCLTGQRESAVTADECAAVLEELQALRVFIEAMPMRTAGGGVQTLGDSAYGGGQFSLMGQSSYLARRQSGGAGAGQSVDQALGEENRSVGALAALLRYGCEVLALWKILCEHQFHLLLAALPADDQTWLAGCHFSDLILAGGDTCAQLIVALINTYLRDNASVGTISEKLRACCPLLYRHEDAVTHKATELLQTCAGPADSLDPEERAERLHVALQLCKDAAPNVPLASICEQFRAAGFYEGVVQLCAAFAQRLDPNGAALHYYQSREPAEDQEGYAAFAARMKCYQEIGVVLDHVQQRQQQKAGDAARPAGGSAPQLLQTVAMCLQTSDQLLHIAVYGWLLDQSLFSDLLNITEPSLGEFLAYSFDRQPDNRHFGDILWKYHERNGRHDRATIILDQLAAAGSEQIRLEQRIEYLARAVMCTRCDSSSGGGGAGGGGNATQAGALLKNLEDKLEVARVQKLILDAVAALDSAQSAEAVRALNYALYDISQLYTDFAEPFELWECKLAILNCSHHNDGLLIESVWANILRLELQREGGGGGGAERLARLLYKVRALSGEYGTAGHCFPLAFLVHELELYCCKLRQPAGAVPEALLAFGGGGGAGPAEGALDVDQLLDLYGRMMSMNERVWATEGNEWHLVESTARLVAVLAEQAGVRIAQRQRRRVMAKAQELMSTCRNLLYPKPGTKGLIDALMQIEAKLQRT